MRNYGKPVTDDVVREFLPLDVAQYSLWMPGDLATAAIQSTRLNPVRTYDEIIELDDVHAACVTYLLRSGAPVFRDAKAHGIYTQALEDRLRQGLAPAAARDAALRGRLRAEGSYAPEGRHGARELKHGEWVGHPEYFDSAALEGLEEFVLERVGQAPQAGAVEVQFPHRQ
jgi:hypothetical protein